jgi:hypothetical protein
MYLRRLKNMNTRLLKLRIAILLVPALIAIVVGVVSAEKQVGGHA